jgi:proliferating cell nuclear antigen PCNA
MEAKLKSGYELIKVFNAIGHITDEATLYFKPSGLEITEANNSNISMLSVAMQPSLLTEYIANQEVKAGVNIANLNKMLKTLPKKSEFSISISSIALEIKSDNKAYSVPIIEHKSSINKEPEIEFTNSISFSTAEFKEALKNLSQISTIAHINISNRLINLSAEGDAGSVENEYSDSYMIIKSTEPITNLCFNITEMLKLIKEADKKSKIELYLKNGEPLKVVYELAGQKLRGFLAPYMESEDA